MERFVKLAKAVEEKPEKTKKGAGKKVLVKRPTKPVKKATPTNKSVSAKKMKPGKKSAAKKTSKPTKKVG